MIELQIRRTIRLFHAASLGLCLLLASGSVCAQDSSSGRWVLRSGKQADKWQDAFVTGNGRHGMMVMGNSLSERITNVHEELFLRAWDRSIVGVPNIARHLAEQRQLIADGKNNEAMFVAGDAIAQAKAAGAGATWELTPHPAFDLQVDYLSPGGLLAYDNQLDLESGEASCRWQRTNAAVEQRVFSSRIANVNVVSLKATHGKKLNLTLSLGETPGRTGMHLGAFDLSAAFSSVTTGSEPGWLSFDANYAVDRSGYEGLARVTHVGGSMVKAGNALTLTDADEVMVLIRISPLADGSTSELAAVKTELAAMPTDYAQLLQPHAAQHGEMFGRVKLDLGAASEWQTKTTQEMLRHVAEKGLSAHYLEAVHAMGRYLLISSCGKYPPPLRGIWGGDWKADWAGGFVLDSNLDLAMSAAGPGNLPECIQSYAGYIERQLPGWRLNATNTFGTRGFMAASFANPETGYQTHKNPVHWYYICQAGWTLRPLYDYALLSKNDTFMQTRVLPLYLEMANFYDDYMVADANGVLHITPGCSPESGTPKPYNTQLADDCTVDLAVAREVYQVLIEQGPKFGIPPAQISAWQTRRNNIAPYRIDANGALAEWAPEKYVVTSYGNRHSSHLYPIFPGFEFFQSGSSAQLLEAARVALRKPIEVEHLTLYDELSGHGIMYAALMSARMREVMNVDKLLSHIARNGFQYDSMVSSHAPNGRYYLLDIALSLPTLLMEMLVFSHPGNIDLMPGWNAGLPAGSCYGLLVRGGHKIDISWAGGTMTSAVLHAGANETLTVRFRDQSASLTVKSGQQYELKNLYPGPQPLPSVQTYGLSNPSSNRSQPHETIEKSVDGNNSTKWCAFHGGKPFIWQMSYATPPAQPLRGYSITSANELPGRDPVRWSLEGSQDGANWTVLDERDLGAPFASRALKRNFGTGNTVSYQYYRFVFQPPTTESMFQFLELALDFTGANYATGHVPANLTTGIAVAETTLTWTAGTGGTRHDVYFGISESAVRNATTTSPEYEGRKTTTSHATGALSPGTTYYWRIDETTSTGTPIYSGHTVRFTTAGVAPVILQRTLPALAGKSVAIWSKFTGSFVRSPGVAGGTLYADRDAYDANGGEGRFLCAAETGGKIALMDLMLQKYVTVANGALVSAAAGTPASRRFTLEDQGNDYYAIRADNGFYVRAGLSGDLTADAGLLTEESLFSIVPIRDGPNVVMRAYNGDDPGNQVSNSIPNEVAQFCDHPADFPVNKVNIRTLQMTPGLSSDPQLIAMRKVWNTNGFEDEAIIPYSTTASLTTQLDGIVNGIKRIESLGYTYDYIILYHEILADLPGGPWSDPRISSPEEISQLRERILLGYNRGDLKHPSYKIFCMPYQFQQSLMGIAPFENTPVGCDAATLAFIKDNFDGLFLEVNGHDYLSRNEHVDAAQAAVWCRANGLEFGITSGLAATKDTVFKSMYQNIFAEMAKVGFDKSWNGMHYILHHVYQKYADRLPEWVSNTTTENARWLIEQVMPPETWALSRIDSDGDGTEDQAEIRAGTFPLGAGGVLLPPGVMAYDDFNFYTSGALNGQAGYPSGFGGTWTSSGATVDAATKTVSQSSGSYRSSRSFSPSPLTTTGIVQVRANVALAANNNYSGLELATTAGSDVNTIQLTSTNSNLQVSTVGTGGVSSPVILANDGQTHQWLLELNLGTREGRAWIDSDPSSSPGAAFTIPTGFQFNALNLATFALGQPGVASVQLQEILILPGAVSTQAGLFEDSPSVFGQPGIVNGYDNAALVDFNNDGNLDFSSDRFLYRNDGGTAFSFARNSGAPGVWADYDNDSLLDQYVWTNGGSLLRPENLIGTSVTTFHDDSVMPLLPSLTANGACWGDWNNDGYVDLYVTGHEVSKSANSGFPDTILTNNSGTHFTSSVLTATNDSRSRGVAACDFDQDNDLDIFVSCSSQRANILWLNNGSGSFTNVAAARGVAGDGTGTNDRGNTIGSSWGDFNNDGLFDLFVANSATSDATQDRSMLLQNNGPGAGYTFQNRWTLNSTFYQESYATSMAADYDNDGDLDLFVTTTKAGDRSKLFRNDGNWTFIDVTDAEGLPSDLGETTAAAWGDANNDGFLDLLTNSRIFTNRGNANKWLKLKLAGDGVTANRAAIGARVRIDLGGGNILVRQVEGGSGKGSQNDPTLHFGLGNRTAPVNLQITWPNGTVQTVTGVELGQTLTVGDPVPTPAMAVSPAVLTPVCHQTEIAPSQQFIIQSSTPLPMEFAISDNASWLSVTPAGGVALRGLPTPVQVAYDTSLLAPGNHTATIIITSADASNSPQTVAVTLTVVGNNTWNGGGANNQWSTAGNWSAAFFDSERPVFAGSLRLTPNNDFPADTNFAGIQFNNAAGAFTLSGNRIMLGGNITFTGNPPAAVTQTINLPMILSADRTITTPTNGAIAVGGIISGVGKLTKTGTGLLLLSNANTHAGGTVIAGSQGAINPLRISNATALGGGGLTIGSGGSNDQSRLELTGGITVTSSVAAMDSRTNLLPSILNISGNNTMSANLSSVGVGDRVTLQSDAGKITLAGNFSAARGLHLAGAGDGEIQGSTTVAATFGLEKTGAGTWTLNNGNLNGNTATISEGKLVVNGALINASANVGGGMLEFTAASSQRFTPTTNGVSNKITGTGTLSLKGAFDINLTGTDITVGNAWTLVNVGSLTETFDASFTVPGFTESANVWTKTDGGKKWTFAEATGTLALQVASYWNANAGTPETPDYSGVWDTITNNWNTATASTGAQTTWTASNNAIFDQAGTYTATINAAQTATNINIKAGAVTFDGISTVSSISITIDSGASLTADSARFMKSGTTTLTVNGTLNQTGALSANTISIAGGNGSIVMATGFRTNGDSNFAGNISGAGQIVTNGAGTITLSGNNSYNGQTLIRSGNILRLGSTTALSNNSFLIFAGTAVTNIVELTGTNFARSLAGSGAGNVQFQGGGSSGFAAVNADRTVAINGTVTWGSGNFNPTVFHLGTAASTHKVTLTTGIDLNAGTRTIDTTDGDAAVEAEISGVLSGTGASALTKTGTGVLLLSGPNIYSGNTTVNGGTLEFTATSSQRFTPTTNGVSNKITGTGTLSLKGAFDIVLTDTDTTIGNTWTLVDVGSLTETFDASFTVPGFTQSANVWTKPDGGNKWTFDEATGILTRASASGGFSAWITGTFGNGPVPPLQQGPNADFDNDGMPNLVEYALNGDPTVSDSSILPDLVVTNTAFEFTYSRLDLSLADTVQTFEYGSDLAGWTPIVIPPGPGVITVGIATITVTDTGSTDSVKISIPESVYVGGKLFGRLKVAK